MAKINHDKKALFFHVPKNAGTSLSVFLNSQGWENVRYSPIDGERDDAAPSFSYARGCCQRIKHNFKLIAKKNIVASLADSKPIYIDIINDNEKKCYKNINQNTWKEYFKFAFTRNPWDRVVSAWKNRSSIEKFEDFVNVLPAPKNKIDLFWHTMPQYDHLFDEDDNLMVDKLYRVENLQDDLKEICDQFQLNYTTIGKINSSKRKPYWEYYTDEMAEKISIIYKNDIEKFNYKYR